MSQPSPFPTIDVIPAKAGIQCQVREAQNWIPAFAGMTPRSNNYPKTTSITEERIHA